MEWLKRLFKRDASRLSDEDDFMALLYSAGVRTEPSRYGAWRCGGCQQMQHSRSLQAWMPDGTLTGDPMWAVLERCRRMMWNGHFTAWCLTCCRKLKPMTAEEMLKYDATPHDPIPVIRFTVSSSPPVEPDDAK